jgi:hypothetical protein
MNAALRKVSIVLNSWRAVHLVAWLKKVGGP